MIIINSISHNNISVFGIVKRHWQNNRASQGIGDQVSFLFILQYLSRQKHNACNINRPTLCSVIYLYIKTWTLIWLRNKKEDAIEFQMQMASDGLWLLASEQAGRSCCQRTKENQRDAKTGLSEFHLNLPVERLMKGSDSKLKSCEWQLIISGWYPA